MTIESRKLVISAYLTFHADRMLAAFREGRYNDFRLIAEDVADEALTLNRSLRPASWRAYRPVVVRNQRIHAKGVAL